MSQIKPNLLFSPGPTLVSPKTLQVLSQPTGHHRTSEFKAEFRQVLKLLKELYQTDDHVFCLTCTGTGAMEASFVNFINKDETILYYDAGKFGERWGHLAKAYQTQAQVLKQNWGEKFPLDALATALKTQKFAAFFIQACETSTATRHDLKEISSLIQQLQPDCLLIVDGITAVGAYDLPMQELSIDVLISGSQKALGLPTGLAFIGTSNKALSKMSKVTQPRFYFDLGKEKKANDQDSTHFSTPVAQIMALKFKLEFILSKGLQKYFLKTEILQKNTISFLQALGCEIFSKSPSPSLTAFTLPNLMPSDELQQLLKKEGLYLASGQDELKGKALRWGHMGDILIQQQIQAYEIFASHASSVLKVPEAQVQSALQAHKQSLTSNSVIDECYPQ